MQGGLKELYIVQFTTAQVAVKELALYLYHMQT